MKIKFKTESNSEVGSGGYVVATEVVAMLESHPAAREETVRGLREFWEGQKRLTTGDSTGALDMLRRAHARFESVPEARLLLGVTKSRLAAAYASLQAFDKAVGYAEDCIAIVAGVKRLSLTEAEAHVNLANSLGLLGKRDESEKHYEHAEAILRSLPGTAGSLETLESNRELVLAHASEMGSDRPFGAVAGIIAFAAAGLAALIVFLVWRNL